MQHSQWVIRPTQCIATNFIFYSESTVRYILQYYFGTGEDDEQLGSIPAIQIVGNPLVNLLQGFREYWQPSEKMFIRCQRVSGNSLKNSSESIGNFCRTQQTFVRGQQISSNPLGIDYPPEHLIEGIGSPLHCRDICKRVAPLTKKGLPFCNTSEEHKS